MTVPTDDLMVFRTLGCPIVDVGIVGPESSGMRGSENGHLFISVPLEHTQPRSIHCWDGATHQWVAVGNYNEFADKKLRHATLARIRCILEGRPPIWAERTYPYNGSELGPAEPPSPEPSGGAFRSEGELSPVEEEPKPKLRRGPRFPFGASQGTLYEDPETGVVYKKGGMGWTRWGHKDDPHVQPGTTEFTEPIPSWKTIDEVRAEEGLPPLKEALGGQQTLVAAGPPQVAREDPEVEKKKRLKEKMAKKRKESEW